MGTRTVEGMRHITPTALAGPTPATTIPSDSTSESCGCLAAQQGVYDTVGEYAATALTRIGVVKEVLAAAAALDWSGSAGSGFHDEVGRLAPMADSYADDIAGISRLCG